MCRSYDGTNVISGFCVSTGGVRDANARSVFSGESRP